MKKKNARFKNFLLPTKVVPRKNKTKEMMEQGEKYTEKIQMKMKGY